MPLDAGTEGVKIINGVRRCDVCLAGLSEKQRRTCSRICSLKKSADNRRGKGSEPYIRIRVNGKRVLLHRYIFEKHVRPLEPDEIVHHKNENKRDNRPENLAAMSRAEHLAEHGYFLSNRFYKYADIASGPPNDFTDFGF